MLKANQLSGFWARRAANFPATDPHFSNVVLLCGFNGTDGATSSTDESPVGRALTFNAQAQIDTAQAKFGVSSLLLDGSVDRVSAIDSADFTLGTSNFTIEAFIRPANVSAGVRFIICQWDSTPQLAWVMSQSGTALRWSVSTTGSDNNLDITGGTLVATTWQHVCIDYDGTKYRLYIDGVMVGSSTTARNIFDSSLGVSIGANYFGASFGFNGHIDEVRMTKNTARYASDSGFTVPAAAYPRS